jgi:hypothetical protein
MLSKGIENMDKVKPIGATGPGRGDNPSRSRGIPEIGLRAEPSPDGAREAPRAPGYQACCARQFGQATVVETGARKTKPHAHA